MNSNILDRNVEAIEKDQMHTVHRHASRKHCIKDILLIKSLSRVDLASHVEKNSLLYVLGIRKHAQPYAMELFKKNVEEMKMHFVDRMNSIALFVGKYFLHNSSLKSSAPSHVIREMEGGYISIAIAKKSGKEELLGDEITRKNYAKLFTETDGAVHGSPQWKETNGLVKIAERMRKLDFLFITSMEKVRQGQSIISLKILRLFAVNVIENCMSVLLSLLSTESCLFGIQAVCSN